MHFPHTLVVEDVITEVELLDAVVAGEGGGCFAIYKMEKQEKEKSHSAISLSTI